MAGDIVTLDVGSKQSFRMQHADGGWNITKDGSDDVVHLNRGQVLVLTGDGAGSALVGPGFEGDQPKVYDNTQNKKDRVTLSGPEVATLRKGSKRLYLLDADDLKNPKNAHLTDAQAKELNDLAKKTAGTQPATEPAKTEPAPKNEALQKAFEKYMGTGTDPQVAYAEAKQELGMLPTPAAHHGHKHHGHQHKPHAGHDHAGHQAHDPQHQGQDATHPHHNPNGKLPKALTGNNSTVKI